MKKQEIYLHLDSSYKIKYEGIDQFEDSWFSEVYMQAVKTVNEIQEKNEGYHQDRKSGNTHRNKEQIYNIISFIGGRGTGKTSAMLSFAEYLKDYYRIRDGIHDNFRMNKSFFVGVDFIDAGLLEKEEDLIEIVLARMLHKLSEIEQTSLYREPDYEYKRKEFYQELKQIYNNLKSLNQKQTNTYWRQESSLDDLLQLSVSYNLRESMKKLIAKFLDLGCYDYIRDKVSLENRYLVIPIDDVDMLVEKGYLMVEQIRRYLMIPNVIVLLSFDYKQLMYICKCHYIKGFSKGMRSMMGGNTPNEKKEVLKWAEHLSKQYLDKMIPDGQKIYLPSLRGESQFAEKKVWIMPDILKNSEEENRKSSCEIQEFILYHLAKGMDIYFYGEKGKCHFLEPESLRKLSNYCHELRNLEKGINFYPESNKDEKGLSKNSKDREIRAEQNLAAFDRNYTWLLKDIYYKIYKDEKIPDNVKEIFNDIQNEGLEVQINRLIDILWKRFYYDENEFPRMLGGREVPVHENSLGDFMYILYTCQKKIPKNLIMLLLAYFSAVLGGKLYLDRLKHFENPKNCVFENVENLGLSNCFGSWDEDILNWKTKKDGNCILGMQDLELFGVVNRNLRVEVSESNDEIQIKTTEENIKNLHMFELIFLFLDNYVDEDEEKVLDMPLLSLTLFRNEESSKIYFEFMLTQNYTARYQISTFIKNIYQYDRILNHLHQSLMAAMDKDKVTTNLNVLLERTIGNEFRKWEKRYGTRMVIPLQNMEFIYRLYLKMLREKPENFLPYAKVALLRRYFETIGQELEQQTTYYKEINSINNDWNPVDYSEIYKQCPLIKRVLNSESEFLSNLIDMLSQGQIENEQKSDDEIEESE